MIMIATPANKVRATPAIIAPMPIILPRLLPPSAFTSTVAFGAIMATAVGSGEGVLASARLTASGVAEGVGVMVGSGVTVGGRIKSSWPICNNVSGLML